MLRVKGQLDSSSCSYLRGEDKSSGTQVAAGSDEPLVRGGVLKEQSCDELVMHQACLPLLKNVSSQRLNAVSRSENASEEFVSGSSGLVQLVV